MRRLFSLCAAAGSAFVAVLACAAVAVAATPLQEYQRTGRITPCKYKPGQLGGNVPNDVAQYAPEFKAQLEAAARARARGCRGGSSGGGSASAAGSGGSGPGSGPGGAGGAPGSAPGNSAPTPPIDPTASGAETGGAITPSASSDSGTSAPLVLLVILGVLGLLLAVVALIGRYLGWSPRWLAPAGHALREARMRVGTSAAGFADWVRPAPRSS